MIPLRVLTKSFGAQIFSYRQWTKIVISTRSCSSSSSSDSSSDSDDEKERTLKSKPTTSTTNELPKSPKQNSVKSMPFRKITNTMDVAMKRRPNINSKSKLLLKNLAAQLTEAAENVADKLHGNKTETVNELLRGLTQRSKPKELKMYSRSILTELKEKSEHEDRVQKIDRTGSPNKPVAEKEYERQSFKEIPTIIPPDLTQKNTVNLPKMKVWEMLEKKELTIPTNPTNYFDELIQWTNEGKLWKFPIDNEQGMDEEQKVHFSDHVFMHRHLKGWCPKAGPIRHFMDLVCIGLSKNPYLTVQEKLDHINWYKEYFASKKALLEDLGCLDNTSEQPQVESK